MLIMAHDLFHALSWLLTVSLGFSIAYHDGKWLQNRKGLW